jgi:hypothetical protein
MVFEYAASYPTNAQKSLASAKSTFIKALGLFESEAIDDGLSIEATPEGDGYWYEIRANEFLREKVQTKIDALPEGDRIQFDTLLAKCSDVVELNVFWGSDNEELIGAFSHNTGKHLAEMPRTDTIKKYERCQAAMKYCREDS